jgi:hypothetical protein
MEVYTSYCEVQSIMGVIVLLFSRVKKTKPLGYLEKRQYHDINDRDILERRTFEHYMVKVWLKACLIAH